jgi:hypothetical protein
MENHVSIISFSVYGANPMYTVGMLRNIELAETIYPGWHVNVYHDMSVPQKYIDVYKKYDHVTTVDMTDSGLPGMFWRFTTQAEVFLSRDADSRLSFREKYAVDEWLYSGKKFHVMRDHVAHNHITVPGGMFGIRQVPNTQSVNMSQTINTWLNQNTNIDAYGQDQIFLKGLYGYYKSDGNIMIHDSIGAYGDDSIPFPTHLAPGYRFVGEVFDENECRRAE